MPENHWFEYQKCLRTSFAVLERFQHSDHQTLMWSPATKRCSRTQNFRGLKVKWDRISNIDERQQNDPSINFLSEAQHSGLSGFVHCVLLLLTVSYSVLQMVRLHRRTSSDQNGVDTGDDLEHCSPLDTSGVKEWPMAPMAPNIWSKKLTTPHPSPCCVLGFGLSLAEAGQAWKQSNLANVGQNKEFCLKKD